MRTRNMGYDDYGFAQGEEKKLKEFCKSNKFTEHSTLLNSAIFSNPSIAPDLYYSIVSGMSYDKLSNIRYIPALKEDFYAYQRRCLANFRNFMIMQGKWK